MPPPSEKHKHNLKESGGTKTNKTTRNKFIGSFTDAVRILTQSKDHRDVYDALVAIRTKHIKEQDGPAKFRTLGGIPKLLTILKSTNSKWLDVALSILGNCALEDKTRTHILSLDGITAIGNVLKNIQQESIQNRAFRSLANLAQDPKCCKVIHNDGVQESESGKTGPKKALFPTEDEKPTIIECAVDLLEKTESVECQQIVVRALRLLADTTEHQDNILQYQGFKFVCKCLKSEEKDVLRTTLKAVGHFMQGVTKESIVWQFVNAEGAASLVALTSHKCKEISNVASSLILSFAKQQMLRPCLGNAGAIDYFIENSKSEERSAKEKIPFINSLCLFCHEVINRVRIRNGCGLELFLCCLEDDDYFVIHYRIISSLVCFLYDDPSMELLIQNKIVKILVHQLQKCSRIDRLNLVDTLLYVPEVVKDRITSEHTVECFKSVQSSNTDGDLMVIEKETIDEEKSEQSASRYSNPDLPSTISEGNQDFDDEDYVEEIPEEETIIHKRNVHLEFHKSVSEPAFYNMKSTSVTEDEYLHGAEDARKTEFVQRQKSETKYSINSPTYREISDFNFDLEDRRNSLSGPRNIFEAQSSKQRNDSPDVYYPYNSPAHAGLYSPLSTSSYASPSWSMGSSPQRCTSPTWSESLYSSPPNSPGTTSNPSGLSASLEWSPPYEATSSGLSNTSAQSAAKHESSLFSPPTSRPLSPLSLVRSPTGPEISAFGACAEYKDLWWGNLMYKSSANSDIELVYSDEEEEETDETLMDSAEEKQKVEGELKNENVNLVKVVVENESEESQMMGLENSMKFLSQDSDNTSYSIPLHADPVYSHTMQATDFGKVLQGESLARTISVESMEASASQPDRNKKEDVVECDTAKEKVALKKRKRSDSLQPGVPLKKKRNVSHTSLLDELLDHKDQSIHKTSEKNTKDDKSSKCISRDAVCSSEKYKSARKTTENHILMILSRLSYMDEQCTHLLNELVLNTLILYVVHARDPIQRAERMLLRLAKNPKCLEGLLLNLLPVKFDIIGSFLKKYAKVVQKYPASKIVIAKNSQNPDQVEKSQKAGILSVEGKKIHCNWNCRDLFNDLLVAVSMVVMSKYGKGVVQHMLLAGNQTEKLTCCLSLPVVCREENFLRLCVMDNGGLSSLITLFQQSSIKENNLLYVTHCLHQLAVIGDLTLLFNGIGINTKCKLFSSYFDNHPKGGKDAFGNIRSKLENVDSSVSVDNCDPKNLVVFILDSKDKVEANRSVLSTKSNVFSAMLDGHYSERDKKEIHIPHTSYKPFVILLELLQEDNTEFDSLYQECLTTQQQENSSDSFDTMLEILTLCDQYLLNDLQHDISNIVFDKLLKSDNVVHVLHFSLQHNCSLLSKRCISYIMLKHVELCQRLCWIKEMVQTPMLDEIVMLVKNVFESYMPTKMQICKI